MKVAIVARNEEKLLQLLGGFPDMFIVTSQDPEFVISFGGDGTLLHAEQLFPGVPKINLKDSDIGKLSPTELSNEEILRRILDGDYEIETLMKLDAILGDRKITALNEIIIHNADPRHAIRYRVTVRDVQVGGLVIGDGPVMSTPFGSTGYYRSITDSIFEVGIGLAFNNSTEQADHVVLRDDSDISIEIARGPARCYADNQEVFISLETGNRLIVRMSAERARIVRVVPVYVWQSGSRVSNL